VQGAMHPWPKHRASPSLPVSHLSSASWAARGRSALPASKEMRARQDLRVRRDLPVPRVPRVSEARV